MSEYRSDVTNAACSRLVQMSPSSVNWSTSVPLNKLSLLDFFVRTALYMCLARVRGRKRTCVNVQPEWPPSATQRGQQLTPDVQSGPQSQMELLMVWTWHSGSSTGRNVDTGETDYPEKQLSLNWGEKPFPGEGKQAKPCLLHEMISPKGRKLGVT